MTLIKPIVDCHLHAHWPQRYPYPPGPGNRPSIEDTGRSAEGLFPSLNACGITHALVVHPRAYGTDNSSLTTFLKESSGRAKGIAVVPTNIEEQDLVNLKSQGVVGIRLHMVGHPDLNLNGEEAPRFLELCQKNDMFIEVFAKCDDWPILLPVLEDHGVKVIVEHLGWPNITDGLQSKGFQYLLKHGRSSSTTTIKISSGFRLSHESPPYADIRPFAGAVLDAFTPNRCMWGSDWPFLGPQTSPTSRSQTVFDVKLQEELSSLSNWINDEETVRKILWDTPARLFGFTQSA